MTDQVQRIGDEIARFVLRECREAVEECAKLVEDLADAAEWPACQTLANAAADIRHRGKALYGEE